MTDKFWVTGGSGLWGDTDNWSLTSGGGSGAAIPAAADDVKLDSSSGSGTVIVNSTTIRLCREFDCTGFTGTLQIGDGSNGKLHCSGNIILVSGMTLTGSGTDKTTHYMRSHDDAQETPAKLTSGGKVIPFPFQYGGSLAMVIEIQDNWVHSDVVNIGTTGTAIITIDALSASETIEAQSDLYYGEGTGDILGDVKVECTGTADLIMNGQTANYAVEIDVDFVSGTRTIKGTGGVSNCTWTYIGGTIIIEGITVPFEIGLYNAGTFNWDMGTAALTIPKVLCTISSAIFKLLDTGHQTTITQYTVNAGIIHTIDNGGNTNALLFDRWGDDNETIINVGAQTFIGDMSFGEFYQEWTTTSSVFTWDNTATYTFRQLFEMKKISTGFTTFVSDHATLRTTFHIYHNARTHLYGLICTRIDALSVGQGMVVQGETAINDCVGIKTEKVNIAVKGLTGTTPTDHPFYTDPIKDPVLISGKAQISAVDQQNAIVIVCIRQTENGIGWYKLVNILETDVDGNWSCNVPAGADVFVSCHYDSGSQKYNSLSKPYISAS